MKHLDMKHIAMALLLIALPATAATFNSPNPTTTDNDDTCDVGLYPAATLLLPYFEVSLDPEEAETTLLTITNTAPGPEAAHVTIWTDYGYPVVSFNIYLTGYDVQNINLYDIIGRGRIAPDRGTGFDQSPNGELSIEDNPRLTEESCVDLPVELPAVYLTRIQSALTLGRIPELGLLPGCNTAGGTHTHAIGYVTIDVVGACTGDTPFDKSYFTHQIRFDNVLMGDYTQVNSNQNFAQGSPMVHIRAVPEGGEVSTRRKTNLENTFYGRLHSASNSTIDGRQPLPSRFAARWIEGGAAGFETLLKIWREAPVTADTTCGQLPSRAIMPLDSVRFDEEENPETFGCSFICDPPIEQEALLPASSIVSVSDESVFPVNSQDAVAGWLYINLHNAFDATTASQSWVTTSMRAEGRFSVDLDATALGNGCSAPVPLGDARGVIGPAPNGN